jgi:hypothetical protein
MEKKSVTLNLPIDSTGHIQLPSADRIQGLTYNPDAHNWRLGSMNLSYSSAQSKHLLTLQVPAADALYLLNILEQWAQDSGLATYRQP